jgi:hypothetical protein
VILSTRNALSRRRLFLLVVLLCVLVAAFAGLHAADHHEAADLCGLAGLGCAVAAALVLLPRIAGAVQMQGAVTRRRTAAPDDRSRIGRPLPGSPDLAVLCRLRV